jgi:DNA-binding NarL/FixJ family response regulator
VSAIRVAVVDDQALFVSGMQMLVESQRDFEFVGSATTGRSGVELAARTEPHIVLMDIRMPGMDGIEATAHILRPGAPSRVIILTTFHRDEAVFRAIRAGASGFITKDATPEFILAAIRTVHGGQAVLAPFQRAAARQRPPAGTGDRSAHTARARDLPARGTRPVQPRGGFGRVRERGDGEDAPPQHPEQAGPAEPHPSRHLRLRERAARVLE